MRGKPKKGETRDKVQDDRDECERVEVERRFTLAKRKCGMGLVTGVRADAGICRYPEGARVVLIGGRDDDMTRCGLQRKRADAFFTVVHSFATSFVNNTQP